MVAPKQQALAPSRTRVSKLSSASEFRSRKVRPRELESASINAALVVTSEALVDCQKSAISETISGSITSSSQVKMMNPPLAALIPVSQAPRRPLFLAVRMNRTFGRP